MDNKAYSIGPLDHEGTNIEMNDAVPDDVTARTKKLLTLSDLEYSVEESPPWYICILLGFQHYLTMFGSTVGIPLLLAPSLCMGEDNVAKSELISTIFFVSGLVTLLQTTFGCRLPIVQGGSVAFFAPTFAILSALEGGCPTFTTARSNSSTMSTMTTVSMTTTMLPCATQAPISRNQSGYSVVTGSPEHREVWQSRIREIQGAIMVASLFQVVIGFSGLMGLLLRFIGPLAITPTIALVGLSLFTPATNFCQGQWWLAMTTIVMITIFSQYLRNVEIPYGKGRSYPVFKLFPVVISIILVWIICAILTATNVLPDDSTQWGYIARTDVRMYVLYEAAWIRFPYPGQWGMPTVSVAGVFGMLAGVLASMIESIGDYYACARLAGAPPPPLHAINRGICVEGIGCVLAGAWGSGNGSTSYSQNIGAIGITKVGSRRVIQSGACIMILLAIVGKFGAVFVTIPNPIMGGLFMVMFGMITSVGLSNLQFVDMNSSRNLFVLGFSIFFGIALPQWISNPQNTGAINTGVILLDQILRVLLGTSMFVGGFTGFLLDNTIPGTEEERGIAQWRNLLSGVSAEERQKHRESLKIYDFPFGMGFLRRIKGLRFVPFCPTFEGYCGGPKDNGDVEETGVIN